MVNLNYQILVHFNLSSSIIHQKQIFLSSKCFGYFQQLFLLRGISDWVQIKVQKVKYFICIKRRTQFFSYSLQKTLNKLTDHSFTRKWFLIHYSPHEPKRVDQKLLASEDGQTLIQKFVDFRDWHTLDVVPCPCF